MSKISEPLHAPSERDFEAGRRRERLAETQKLQPRSAPVVEYEDAIADLIDQSRGGAASQIMVAIVCQSFVGGEGVTGFHGNA